MDKARLLKSLTTDSQHVLVGWLFLRGLSLIYLAAFFSMSVQIEGLIGAQGILPIREWLDSLAPVYGAERFWLFPTLFWLDASDGSLKLVCLIGAAASLLLLFNVLDRTALVICYLLYLSITVAGQDFTAFQWDVFLLEVGFLAIFLTFGSGLTVWLFRFLIARFMFMGGVVKLASGDPSWADLTALNYHYLTQPLPSPLAYYAYFLPHWFHQLCVAGVFFIELIVPFLVFFNRPCRLFAAWSFIALQSAIVLTGSYNFFNLLTLLLCLMLFDGRDVRNALPKRIVGYIDKRRPKPGRVAQSIVASWAVVVLMVCVSSIWVYHDKGEPIRALLWLNRMASTYAVVNNYGPFSVMTTERREIVVEGSNDGIHWQPYLFNYKPVELDQSLAWNVPHQPRLDWQMWFAALEEPVGPSWFGRFLAKLKLGSPEVLSLLRNNPFPGRPPHFVRAVLYRYTFNPPERRTITGQIWHREYLGLYHSAD